MSKKISIDQIASWRSGELITEQKLQQVFTLIGEVINLNSIDLEKLTNFVSQLNIAARWLTIVDNYKDIDKWVEDNKGKGYDPEIPFQGDTIMVNNNSDDPNLPPGINPGRYLYIYTISPITQIGKWALYNPFALVNATQSNDGLMSKEAFTKLDELPNNSVLDNRFTQIEANVSTNTEDLKKYKPLVDTNIQEISSLKNRTQSLEQTKQDKRTDTKGTPLQGYTSTTVEDNLVEVKSLVDEALKQDITIWIQQTEQEKKTTGTITNNNLKISIPFDNLDLTNHQYVKLYYQINVNHPTLKTPIHALASSGRVINQIEDDKTVNILFELPPFILNDTYPEMINGFCKYINNGTYSLDFTLLNFPASLNGATVDITPLKIIKDIGVSDYMWSDVIEQEIKEYLNNSLGIKRQLITRNIKPDGFNGFKPNDEYKLNLTYVLNSNAVSIYQGGVKLIQGVEYQEVQGSDNVYSDKIKFLKEINIEKDGELLIEAVSLVLNQVQLRIWNPTAQYLVGNIVISDGKIWYCLVENINQKPYPASTYWEEIFQDIDIEQLKEHIKGYINDVADNIVAENIDKKQNGSALIFSVNELITYLDHNSYLEMCKELVKLKAYVWKDNQKSYIDTAGNDEQSNPIAVRTQELNNYPVKFLANVYVDCLANLKIAQATPDEIGQEIKAQLSRYANTLITTYKEMVIAFEDINSFNEFKRRNNFQDSDFEDLTSSDISSINLISPDTTKTAAIKAEDDGTLTVSSFTGNLAVQVNGSLEKSILAKQNDVDIISGNVRTNTTNITTLQNTTAKKNEHNTFTKPQTVLGDANNQYPAINVRGAKQTDSAINIYTNNTNNDGVIQNKAGGVISLRNIANPTNPSDGANKSYVDSKFNSIPQPDLSNYYNKSEADAKYAKVNENNLFYGTQMVIGNLDIKGSGGNASNYARFFNFDYNNQNFTALKFITNGRNKLQIQANNTTGESVISTGGENVLTITNLKNPVNSNDAVNKGYIDTNFVNKSYVDSNFSKRVKTFKFYLNQARWITGGALGGRWDRYSCAGLSIPSDMTFGNVYKIILYSGSRFGDYIIEPSANDLGGITIKRMDSDGNENKDDWEIMFYYIPYK